MDGDTFKPISRFASHYALHGGPKFSPDGRFVYFASRDGWVTQYDLYSLQVVADIRVGLNTRNLAVSDDGKWVLAGNTCLSNTGAAGCPWSETRSHLSGGQPDG
ncbi:cytochrome D1 domain-containing protein [Paludibacterium denitrificans]|uniref:cytochrome D1 domain-containing protein n=1 Tax=Paludibacterium denitrificans TaxID=2675226 RepID=UPI002477CE10|nr:cytochrome D1 domain-containing protein [Paludibacterium denitrificans]